MSAPTEKQINAAHWAWEETAAQWQLRKVSNYGMAGDIWILQSIGSPRFEAGRDYANEIAAYKFDGPNAEKNARWKLRDKIVQAVVAAVLSKQEG